MPSLISAAEYNSLTIDSTRMTSVYDLCMNLARMQITLVEFERSARGSTRTETRPLVLASKATKAVITSLQPALATVSLLAKVCEGMAAWLSARSYLFCDEEVFIARSDADNRI
jgi:hypothetical protein